MTERIFVPDNKLLGSNDPQPVEVINQTSLVPILLTCEHAGQITPKTLKNLHLASDVFDKHIAYDIGAKGLATKLAYGLEATLILQRYSRLVIDCNRPYDATDCITPISDGTPIPGNQDLNRTTRAQRYTEIHEPYHRTISGLLDARQNRPIMLVSIHSFTPRMKDVERPWHAGLLFNHDDRVAKRLMRLLTQHNLNVAYNQPYTIDSFTDYTIPVHGEGRNIPHVLIEIRNDEIECENGQKRWAGYIGNALKTIVWGPDPIFDCQV